MEEKEEVQRGGGKKKEVRRVCGAENQQHTLAPS